MNKYYKRNTHIRDVKHIKLHQKNIYKIFYRELNVIYINDNFDETSYDSKIIVIR